MYQGWCRLGTTGRVYQVGTTQLPPGNPYIGIARAQPVVLQGPGARAGRVAGAAVPVPVPPHAPAGLRTPEQPQGQ